MPGTESCSPVSLLQYILGALQSTLEDYEAVPVEEYGMAMLHGMGWKAGEGIGLKNKG